MFIENYQSGDALSKSLDSRLNASSLLWQLHELFAPCVCLYGGWELTPAYFMLELHLVFFAFNSHL